MASSSSSFSNSSSVNVPRTKHDVFISFRGEDTRTSFLSHLEKELRRSQIDVYVDDDKLRPGDEISSTLLQAIEEAFISLIIFSEHYASSTWCLGELVKIIECMERHQRIVIPIFYNVNPSDVRRQKRTFEEAFDVHKDKYEENMSKVEDWRCALKKAANLSGFHYPSNYRNESELIEKIVKDVLEKLPHIFSSESKGLVGIEEKFKDIEPLLAIESSEVRILGIWGMGGIGKTTIAEALFKKYSSQYEGCCFLENEKKESRKYDQPSLYVKFVSKLRDEEILLLKEPAKARFASVKGRLTWKKVLIVLDNVDALEQIEHLTEEQICLGPGSRVIITTRDKQILRRVHGPYELQGLNFKNSLQLFCLNAFHKVSPEIDYEKLSEMAVHYANGIPLALKVLGSYLCSRSIEVWESAVRKLKSRLDDCIFHVLKLSYDGLDDTEKNIFLDIAFFFKGENKDHVIRFLDSCDDYFAPLGIDNLQCKALITISDRNTIEMHDLIEQMGWEIVRQESTKDPGRRSRLRNPKDVYNVLENNKGTESVEGIMLDLCQIGDLHLNADTFKKMPNLRFLKLHGSPEQRSSTVIVRTPLESFSDKLRYLEWNRCPLKSLQSTFCIDKLVELHMPNSQVTKFWDGVQDLVNLKEINLLDSKRLVELPDLTNASNLECICLQGCNRLRRLHPSIFTIDTLKELSLWGCQGLKSFKGEFPSKSLRYVNLGFCGALEEFSISTVRSAELRDLNLCRSRLERLPDELCFLTSLGYLRLMGCGQLIELPHNIKALSRLRFLHLYRCESLRSLPEVPPSLRILHADKCTSLRTIFSLKAALSLDLAQIRFADCTSLDEHSLDDIMEDAPRSMVRAIIRYAVGDPHHLEYPYPHYDLGQGEVCYPGSESPEWFRYKTSEASITVELEQPCHHLLGFLVCFIISRASPPPPPPPPSRSRSSESPTIYANIRIRDGERDLYSGELILPYWEIWNSDRVYIWRWPSDWGRTVEYITHYTTYNLKISCEFIKAYSHGESTPLSLAKGCGFHPIYVSDVLNYVEMELESDDKSKKDRDLDDLDLNAVKREMILRMKEEPVPQSKIFDLPSSSSCNNLEED